MMTRMEWQEALRTLEKVAERFEQAEWVCNRTKTMQHYNGFGYDTHAAGPARSVAQDALDDAHAIESVREHLPLLLDAYRQAVRSIRHRDEELTRLREKVTLLEKVNNDLSARLENHEAAKRERPATTREIVEATEQREMLESLVTALEHNPVLRGRVRAVLLSTQ